MIEVRVGSKVSVQVPAPKDIQEKEPMPAPVSPSE